jgi:hypothetical protein
VRSSPGLPGHVKWVLAAGGLVAVVYLTDSHLFTVGVWSQGGRAGVFPVGANGWAGYPRSFRWEGGTVAPRIHKGRG